MKGKPEFVLIDDQKTTFESALAAASAASEEAPKVLIIEGGPGTGKTVLAINLLVKLTGLGLLSKYVSKNAAPRKVYESKLVGTVKRSHFSNFFSGSGARRPDGAATCPAAAPATAAVSSGTRFPFSSLR